MLFHRANHFVERDVKRQASLVHHRCYFFSVLEIHMKQLAWLSVSIVTLALALPAKAAESIVTEGVVGAPVGAVWNAWTTTTGLKAWLAPHADIDLKIDGVMRSNYDPKGSLGDPGTIENKVLAYEPERMLSIKVAKAPEKFPFKTKISDMWTVLYFQPTVDGKTLLRIVGMGFGADEESQKMKDFFIQGNAYTLAQLQKHFQR
jgi:uncharacterized protein YndB with AHSA1/START domain